MWTSFMKSAGGSGWLLVLALFAANPEGRAEEPKGTAKEASSLPELADKSRRRVYVLHSGLHTILSDPAKNIAAETIKDGLRQRGVAERDLIVLENPFPYASWKTLLPFESLTMFFDAVDPASKMSHDLYLRMHKALKAKGVISEDILVWVGHSAGGQIGLTMANLARNQGKYPDLAAETSPYHLDMVITLGTPIYSKYLPPEVQLRHYYSTEDKVVRWVSKIGPWVTFPLGYRTRLTKVPSAIGENGIIRYYRDIEHPSWDEAERVLDRIVGETEADFRPPWRSHPAVTRWGLSLSELLCQALEEECHIAVEDPPK